MTESPDSKALPLSRQLLFLAGWTALFALFACLARVSVPKAIEVPALYLTAIVGACATGVLLWAFTGASRNWTDLAVGLGVFILLVKGLNSETLIQGLPLLAARISVALPLSDRAALTLLNILALYLANLSLVGASLCAGELVAKGLRAPSYLVLAALVAAMADIFSVFLGPTREMANSEAILRHMALYWPAFAIGGAIPIVGVGDFLFLCLFLAGARKFSLGATRNLVALLVAFVVGIGCTLLSDLFLGTRGLPALPFMCAAFLWVNRRKLTMTPQDLRTVVKVSALFAGVFLALAIAKALKLI